MQAYWTTDIVVFNPSCSWQTTNTTGIVDLSTHPVPIYFDIELPETNTSIELYVPDFVSSAPSPPTVSTAIPRTTGDPYTFDSSVVFVISEFQGPNPAYHYADFSALPTLQFSTGNVVAFLQCFPHASIQTHQVRTTGNGILTLGQTQQRQGNLDIDQVNSLLNGVLLKFPTSSGPVIGNSTSAAMMNKLLFGNNFTEFGQGSGNTPPAPLANITAVYKLAIQSAMKTFMSGAVGTSDVPGGFAVPQLVFSSSLGHVISAAILFALLTIALVAAQYRKGRDAFTLIHVAAALEGSDVPKECVQMRQLSGRGDGQMVRLVPDDNTEGGMIVLVKSDADESVSA